MEDPTFEFNTIYREPYSVSKTTHMGRVTGITMKFLIGWCDNGDKCFFIAEGTNEAACYLQLDKYIKSHYPGKLNSNNYWGNVP